MTLAKTSGEPDSFLGQAGIAGGLQPDRTPGQRARPRPRPAAQPTHGMLKAGTAPDSERFPPRLVKSSNRERGFGSGYLRLTSCSPQDQLLSHLGRLATGPKEGTGEELIAVIHSAVAVRIDPPPSANVARITRPKLGLESVRAHFQLLEGSVLWKRRTDN